MPLLVGVFCIGQFQAIGFFAAEGWVSCICQTFLFSALGSPIYLLCTAQDKFLGGDGYDPHHAKFLQSVYIDEEEEQLKTSSYTLFVG